MRIFFRRHLFIHSEIDEAKFLFCHPKDSAKDIEREQVRLLQAGLPSPVRCKADTDLFARFLQGPSLLDPGAS